MQQLSDLISVLPLLSLTATHTQTTHTPNLSQALFITHYALNTLAWLRAGPLVKLIVYTIEHSLCIVVLFF